MSKSKLIVFCLFCISQFGNCRDPYEDVEKEKSWAAEIRKKYTVDCASSVDSKYLTGLLAELSDRADQNPYKFEVCLANASADVNAYAFPAGYIVINRGLLSAVHDESELAFVLGHEMSHVILRHAFNSEKKKQWGNKLFSAMKNPILRVPLELFGPLGMLKYTREHEKYADLAGLDIAQRTGFDPRGSITFFEGLRGLEFRHNTILNQLLSTHPPTEERLNYVRRQINRLPTQENYRKNSLEFLEMKKRYPIFEDRR